MSVYMRCLCEADPLGLLPTVQRDTKQKVEDFVELEETYILTATVKQH